MNDENDIPVILKDLPTTIHGFCCLGSDYEPLIVLNAALSQEQQRNAYVHEMKHIRTGEIFDGNYVEYK